MRGRIKTGRRKTGEGRKHGSVREEEAEWQWDLKLKSSEGGTAGPSEHTVVIVVVVLVVVPVVIAGPERGWDTRNLFPGPTATGGPMGAYE